MTELRWLEKTNGELVLQFLRDGSWINVTKEKEKTAKAKRAALDEIEDEIITRACPRGVCED